MHAWWALLGVPVIVLVTYDAVVTALSATSAGGPITRRTTRHLWRLLRTTAAGPRSGRLAAAGPLVLVALLVTWGLGLWLGWSAVFAAAGSAVVDAESGRPVGGWDRVYYAGFVLSTLGVGDVVAEGAVWRTATVVAAVNGFGLLTLAVSYLIPVTEVVRERRRLGTTLYGLGATVEEVLDAAWDGRDLSALTSHLQALAPELAEAAQNYLSYPVVHTFHDPTRTTALEPGVATLHEVLVLVRHVPAQVHGIDAPTLRMVETAFGRLVDVLEAHVVAEPGDPPPVATGPLEERRIAVTGRDVVTARVHHRRAVLAAWVADGRWRWEADVVAPS